MTVIEKKNEGITEDRKVTMLVETFLTSLSRFARVQLVGSMEKMYKYLHFCETPQNTA